MVNVPRIVLGGGWGVGGGVGGVGNKVVHIKKD